MIISSTKVIIPCAVYYLITNSYNQMFVLFTSTYGRVIVSFSSVAYFNQLESMTRVRNALSNLKYDCTLFMRGTFQNSNVKNM